MEAFLESIKAMPYPGLLPGVGLAAIVLQLVVLKIAWRRRRRGSEQPDAMPIPTLRPPIVAGLGLLAVPVAAGFCMRAARGTMFQAFELNRPDEKAVALSAGISGQINTIPFAVAVTSLAFTLWLAVLAVVLDARGLHRSHRPFPREALIAAGMASICAGTLQWSIAVIKGFAGVAGAAPEAKAQLLLHDLDFARRHLESFARISQMSIAGLAALAIGLMLLDRRDQPDTPTPPAGVRPSRIIPVASAALLLAAFVLYFAARPWRAENQLPWPPSAAGEPLQVVDPVTPDLAPPDPIERAPVVMVWTDRLALDGYSCSPEALAGMLGTLKNNFALLHPGEGFNGKALVVADAKAPSTRIAQVLRAIRDADYTIAVFTFTRAESTIRPTFGTLARVSSRGALVTLIEPFDVGANNGDPKGGEPGSLVRLEDFPDYDGFARRIVALRRAGESIVVNVGK